MAPHGYYGRNQNHRAKAHAALMLSWSHRRKVALEGQSDMAGWQEQWTGCVCTYTECGRWGSRSGKVGVCARTRSVGDEGRAAGRWVCALHRRDPLQPGSPMRQVRLIFQFVVWNLDFMWKLLIFKCGFKILKPFVGLKKKKHICRQYKLIHL